MNPQDTADVFEPFAQAFMRNWSQALESMQSFGAGRTGAPGWELPQAALPPAKLARLRDDYLAEAAKLWREGFAAAAPVKDKRFAGAAWTDNPLAAFSAALYLLNARTLLALADAVEADEKTRARLRFAVEQWLAAASPSNFLAFNAEAQRKAVETRGASIAQGVRNLLKDIQQGHLSLTDESAFEVGRNVATTEGAVVFENALFQLIEYKPLGAKVFERPLLIVPPCINKFYILDLQPENSLVRHALGQGHHVFVVSWVNPGESLREAGWDDYIEQAAIRAIDAVLEISGSERLNLLGFCVGGTIAATALAVLAARGRQPAASLTLLTTLLDFSDTGVLDLFIDEASVRTRELQLGQGGLLPGIELASTFSFLRPNDLVWNYVVGNYLKGETPPPFDLLYWNSDSTNLPGPFYAWYLRNAYLENKLRERGALTVCGQKLDFGAIQAPVYIYGSREDHIVPIGAAYASTQLLPGKKRFVMGASGHIAGVINPPALRKRSHWLREDGKFPKTHAQWLAGATENPGSWWDDWAAWLRPHAGKQAAAPRRFGRGTQYKAIEPAPGRYVKG